MGKFVDNIFSEVRSVNINELIEKEQDLEIICENFSQQDTLAMINSNYRILLVKNMQYVAQKSLDKNRQLLLDVCREYNRSIDIFPKIYEEKSGVVPLNKTISTYFIVLNPNNHIRSLLNFIVSIDNIGTLSNSISIYTSNGMSNDKFYGYYNMQVSPNRELIQYMRDLKFGDIPFNYFLNQKVFIDTISSMQQIVEASVCSMIDVFENYDCHFVIKEVKKWLRTSKKTWVAGQIESKKIKFETYENIAKKYYENRRFVYPNR